MGPREPGEDAGDVQEGRPRAVVALRGTQDRGADHDLHRPMGEGRRRVHTHGRPHRLQQHRLRAGGQDTLRGRPPLRGTIPMGRGPHGGPGRLDRGVPDDTRYGRGEDSARPRAPLRPGGGGEAAQVDEGGKVDHEGPHRGRNHGGRGAELHVPHAIPH